MLTLTERELETPRWRAGVTFVLCAARWQHPDLDYFVRPAPLKAIHDTDAEMPPTPDIVWPDTWRDVRRARKEAAN